MSTQLSSTVGTWALKPSATAPAENWFTVGLSPEGNETALIDDSRTLVDPADIQPGGKYYSIVKLQIRYEKQDASDTRWAQGSGWLIKPDLLITAGHCAFDHTYGLGRAVEVKVYVGYSGKDSVGQPGVQFRHGARILAPSGWLASDLNRQNDVSFMQLNAPFDNVTPFKYQPTPTNGNKMLGVVGYPADKTYKDEAAARMYYQYKQVNFDLESSFLHMLEYTISSFGGQSGSPVIIQGQNVSIGTHVYGLGEKNSASVVRGTYGNFYRSYENALAAPIAAPTSTDLWTTLDLPATEDAMLDTPLSETESFWDTLKDIVHVGANVGAGVLSVGSPFLGPIGGPIAAVAGAALSAAGKVTESSMISEPSSSSVSSVSPATTPTQQLCRAIVGEAALQAVFKMDVQTANKHGLFEAMRTCYHENRANVPGMAKALGPALLLPATRIALNSTGPSASVTAPYPAVPAPVGTEASFDGDEAAFASALIQTAKVSGGTEGFFDFLGPIVNTAIKVAPIAIGAVGDIAKAVGGESAFVPFVQDDLQPHVETLCHRALLGDAVLKALVKVPVSELQHQESFFSGMIDTVKSIAATAIKAAPSVIRVVEPIVHQLIQQKLNGESSLQPGTVVDKHHSLDDWLNDDSVSEMPSVLSQAAADPPAPAPPKLQQNGVHPAVPATKMVDIPIGKAIAAF